METPEAQIHYGFLWWLKKPESSIVLKPLLYLRLTSVNNLLRWVHYFFKIFCYNARVPKSCKLNIFSFFYVHRHIQCAWKIWIYSCDVNRIFFIFEKLSKLSNYFSNNGLILKWKFHISKSKFKVIHAKYVQYKCTFSHTVVYRLIEFTRFLSDDGLHSNCKRG